VSGVAGAGLLCELAALSRALSDVVEVIVIAIQRRVLLK